MNIQPELLQYFKKRNKELVNINDDLQAENFVLCSVLRQIATSEQYKIVMDGLKKLQKELDEISEKHKEDYNQ